jgi:hypothetical protein
MQKDPKEAQLRPSYEKRSHAAELMLLAFGCFFGVAGAWLIVSRFSVSSIDVIAGGILLGGSVMIPLIIRSNSTRTRDSCVRFVDSVSDLIGHWARSSHDPFGCSAYCELLDGNYLELNLRGRNLNVPYFTIYKFLAPPQIVKKAPLIRMGMPDKRILPGMKIPLEAADFQKWTQQPEKWKESVAGDEELRGLILTHSLRYLLMKHRLMKGIMWIDAAGYDTYFKHPSLKGQFLHGKTLGVRLVYQESKKTFKESEISQPFNKQLVNISERILEHIARELSKG